MSQTPNGSARPLDTAASAVGHLYEAKERLKDAASAAGAAVKQAASSAIQEGRESVGVPLRDAGHAAREAANEAGQAVRDEAGILADQGRELLGKAGQFVRQHPVATATAAFVTGWWLSRSGRRR